MSVDASRWANSAARHEATRVGREARSGTLRPRPTIRRLWWIFVRRWETEICSRCGRPVSRWLASWWSAPDDLWMEIVGDETEVWCPRCFTEQATKQGAWIRWEAVRDDT